LALLNKIFGKALTNAVYNVFTSSSQKSGKSPFTPAGRFINVGDQITWIPDNLESFVVNGYQANDIIYSIVNMIMEKIKVAPWGLYQVVDEQALKKYNSFLEQKNFLEARRMRTKALEPLTKLNVQTGRLAEILKWPNECETWNDIVANDSGFINITGNSYLWNNFVPSSAAKGLPGELIHLPAQHMAIRSTTTFPQRTTGYHLNIGWDLRKFGKEEVLHQKLFNPSYGKGGEGLYGQSPIKAALRTNTRNNAAKEAGAVQLQNNGAVGIAYVDDPIVPATGREKQVDAVKSAWNKQYTGASNYGKVAFSGYKMGYTQVGLSLEQMALTDIEQVDLRILANVWGLPSQLLNDPENKTFNNQKEAEKALTSRCALPRLTSFRNQFNRKLQKEWGYAGVNVYADFDMSVYTELQEDQKEKWEWVKQLPVSSAYKLEMMGLDVPEDPNLDVILVDGNLVPLSDVINVMDEDQLARVNEELNKAGLKDYLRIAK
jgi:HK97 family phage portal protein